MIGQACWAVRRGWWAALWPTMAAPQWFECRVKQAELAAHDGWTALVGVSRHVFAHGLERSLAAVDAARYAVRALDLSAFGASVGLAVAALVAALELLVNADALSAHGDPVGRDGFDGDQGVDDGHRGAVAGYLQIVALDVERTVIAVPAIGPVADLAAELAVGFVADFALGFVVPPAGPQVVGDGGGCHDDDGIPRRCDCAPLVRLGCVDVGL